MSFKRADKSHDRLKWADRTNTAAAEPCNSPTTRSASRRYTSGTTPAKPMPPLPDNDNTPDLPPPHLWCEELNHSIHPADVQSKCAGMRVQPLYLAAGEARHVLTCALPLLDASQRDMHAACSELDVQVSGYRQRVDHSIDQVNAVFARLQAELEQRKSQLLQEIESESATVCESLDSLRDQVVELGGNLETAKSVVVAVLECDDTTLLQAYKPLSGSILDLCGQAQSTTGFEDPSIRVQFTTAPAASTNQAAVMASDLAALSQQVSSLGLVDSSWTANPITSWGWISEGGLLVTGNTVVRQHNLQLDNTSNLTPKWLCAAADIAYSRGRHQWELQMLRFGDGSDDYALESVKKRVTVQQQVIRGLSELGATSAEAAKRAGVWSKVKQVGDQSTIQNAEIIVGVAPASAPVDRLLEEGCGFMTRTGGLLLHNREVLNYGEPLLAKDVISVLLDLHTFKLSFCRNGRSMGVAFDQSLLQSMGPVRAFVALAVPGASVRLTTACASVADSDPSYAMLRAATITSDHAW